MLFPISSYGVHDVYACSQFPRLCLDEEKMAKWTENVEMRLKEIHTSMIMIHIFLHLITPLRTRGRGVKSL